MLLFYIIRCFKAGTVSAMNFRQIPAVLFFVLAFVYCKPVLSGKVLQSGDDVNAVSAVQESNRYTQQTGDHSWWTNAMDSGMPSYQSGGAEYRADRQAVTEGYADALISALKKLARENFSDLAPSPVVVRLEYSHPTLSQRIDAIEKLR